MADENVANFTAITGASAEEAQFYIGASNGDVNAAIESFYSGGGMDVEDAAPPAPVPAAAPPPVSRPPPPAARGGMGGMGGMGASASSAGGSQRRAAPNRGAAGNVRSLSDMRGDEDDDDHEAEYYTGGQKSGMMVQDPKKKGDNGLDDLFDRARASEAEYGTPEDLMPQRSGGGGSGAFQGTARTLSGEAPAASAAPAAAAAAGPPPPTVHTIVFWQNGFTVNDGPLRRLDDPANIPFLDAIGKGECPRELATSQDPNQPVHVNLVRKDEKWSPPPEPSYRAFHGTGRTLAGDSAADGAAAAAAVPVPAPPAAAAGEFAVDDGKPVTTLQLRLNDGTRLVARFNLTHTVGDVRRFIVHSRPGAPATFRLCTAFPPADLADDAVTIEAAGLANAVVIQK